MLRSVVLAGLLGGVTLVGCAEEPPPKPPPVVEVQEAPDVPTYCASKEKPCVPPQEFVDQLCQGHYPAVAAYLFQKHTPFQRHYIKSHNPESKGVSSTKGAQPPLVFAEELLLLRVTKTDAGKHKQPSAEERLLLRWDGTCVSLSNRDVVTYLTGAPKAAPLDYDALDTTMHAAVLRDKKLQGLHDAREAACKQDKRARACDQASQALSEQLVTSIRQGLRLPMPRERPGAVTRSHPVPTTAAAD